MKIGQNIQNIMNQQTDPEPQSNEHANLSTSDNLAEADILERFQQQNSFNPDLDAQQQQLQELEKEKQAIINKEREQEAALLGKELANAEQAEKAQEAANLAKTEGEVAGTATDVAVGLIPFGIGNWFDGKGTWESDLGKTIISTICPIPFVAGLLANWGGEWLGNAMEDSFNWTKNTVSDAVDWTGGAAKTIGNGVVDGAEDFGKGVGDVATSAADDAGDALSDAGEAAGDVVSDVFDW